MIPLLYFFPGRLDLPAEFAARFAPDPARGPARQGNIARGAYGPPSFDSQSRGLLASQWSNEGLAASDATHRWEQYGDHWIGVAHSPRPLPEEFAHYAILESGVMRGQRVRLADGQDWYVPCCHAVSGKCDLPMIEKLVTLPAQPPPARQRLRWVKFPAPAHQHLAERAAAIAADVTEAFLNRQDLHFDDDDLRSLIAAALALNYDLTLEECSALEIFGPDAYPPATFAIIDWPALSRAILDQLRAAQPPPAAPDPAPAGTGMACHALPSPPSHAPA